MKDVIVEQIMDKFQRRSELGMLKYGTTLAQNNKDNYLIHLQQELMDATLYIEKLLSMEKELTKLVKDFPIDSDLGREVRKLVS